MDTLDSISVLDNKPHYDSVYEILGDFIDNDIDYPIDFKQLCKIKGWKLIEYTCFDDKPMSISSDGFSVYDKGEYSIFYNTMQSDRRIQFTLAHEVGHIVLYHHLKSKKKILSRGSVIVSDSLEKEANCFARNLLCPAYLVKGLGKKDIRKLSDDFNVSRTFMKLRMKFLNWDFFNLKHTNEIEDKFDNIISVVHDYETRIFECIN